MDWLSVDWLTFGSYDLLDMRAVLLTLTLAAAGVAGGCLSDGTVIKPQISDDGWVMAFCDMGHAHLYVADAHGVRHVGWAWTFHMNKAGTKVVWMKVGQGGDVWAIATTEIPSLRTTTAVVPCPKNLSLAEEGFFFTLEGWVLMCEGTTG